MNGLNLIIALRAARKRAIQINTQSYAQKLGIRIDLHGIGANNIININKWSY